MCRETLWSSSSLSVFWCISGSVLLSITSIPWPTARPRSTDTVADAHIMKNPSYRPNDESMNIQSTRPNPARFHGLESTTKKRPTENDTPRSSWKTSWTPWGTGGGGACGPRREAIAFWLLLLLQSSVLGSANQNGSIPTPVHFGLTSALVSCGRKVGGFFYGAPPHTSAAVHSAVHRFPLPLIHSRFDAGWTVLRNEPALVTTTTT